MIVVTTPAFAVSLPDRFVPGQPLSAVEAAALQRLLVQRLRWYASNWLSREGANASQVRIDIAALALSYEFSARSAPDEPLDALALEARRIARELVQRRLAAEGLSLDEETLTRHAQHVAKLPAVVERAQEILRLRQTAGRAALGDVA